MSIYSTLAYCQNTKKGKNGLPWYHDILQYIKDQWYLKGATKADKRTIKRLAENFILDGEILYKKG